ICRSVPQIDATFTFTSTSVRPKAGIFTWRISAPAAASGLTTASIVVAMIATYKAQYPNRKLNQNTKHTILAPRAPGALGLLHQREAFPPGAILRDLPALSRNCKKQHWESTPAANAKTTLPIMASKHCATLKHRKLESALPGFCNSADFRLLSFRDIGVGVSGRGALQRRGGPRLSRAQHA